MTPEGMDVFLREKKAFIPWEKIALLCLGIVREPLLQPHSTIYTQIKKAAEKIFSREMFLANKRETGDAWREAVYLEIFTRRETDPFRVDSAHLDYRNFLERIEYSTEANFRNFLRNLAERVKECEVDESFTAYVNGQKWNVKNFAHVYDFQSACKEKWLKCQTPNP